MVTIINTQEVKDFSEWKKGFDAGATNRSNAGVNVISVNCEPGNGNKITIISEMGSRVAAEGFINAMKQVMEAMGAISVDVQILDKVL